MFHSLTFRIGFLLLCYYLQVEIQGSPSPPPPPPPPQNELHIVGGTTAGPGEFPHQVYLSEPGSGFFCGGSIISKWLILTAGHCLRGRNASSITIAAGAHDRSNPSGKEQIRAVDQTHVHPNFTRVEKGDDIAIIVLNESLSFSEAVRSIGLPDRDAILAENATTTVTGWGRTAASEPNSEVLKKVTVPIVPNPRCNSQYADMSITEQMFCAGEEGQDACTGDSGGPALCRAGTGLVDSSPNYVLCGIVSFGLGCAHRDYPGVYVQVSKYISWILGILKNSTLENPCLRDGVAPSSGAELTKCVTKYLLPESETGGGGGGGVCGVGVKQEPGFLLVSNTTSILRIALNQVESGVEQLINLGSLAEDPLYSVDFDLKNNDLYWTDVRGAIRRVHMNGSSGQSEQVVLVSPSNITKVGLAFDWTSGNLYFADYEQSTIEVIRVDQGGFSAFPGGKTMSRVLLTQPDVNKPWGIAVHPAKGYIFWTNWNGQNSFIGRAHLDGSTAKRIVLNDGGGGNLGQPTIETPTGIALDYSEDRIYWMDIGLERMSTADLNGGDVKIVLQADARISYPLAVGIYKNMVYWTEWRTKGLYKAPLRDDKTVATNLISEMVGGFEFENDLKVYGGDSQQGENLCIINSNCKFICMGASRPGSAATCLCPDGYAKRYDECV